MTKIADVIHTPRNEINKTTQEHKQISINNDKGNLIMSLPKEDVRSKVAPDIKKMLAIIANHHNKTIQEVSSLMLEKYTIAEFHELRVTARKIQHSGLMGED